MANLPTAWPKEPKNEESDLVLGTLSLLALIVSGAQNYTPWVILPLAILNTFIGIHWPPERVLRLREIGASYWGFVFSSFPTQAIFAAVFYGIGYLIGLIVGFVF